MRTLAPKCYECQNKYASKPIIQNGKPVCKKYPEGIPSNIFYESGECQYCTKK